jgi:hypothetical protein
VNPTVQLTSGIFMNLTKIMTWSTNTHDPFTRSSIQTLIVTSCLDSASAALKEGKFTAGLLDNLVSFLNSCSAKDCLVYRTTTWNQVIELFTSLAANPVHADMVQKYLLEDMKRFLDESNSSEYTVVNSSSRLAKVLLVLADATKPEVYSMAVEMVVDKLVDCNKYAYASAEKVEKCLGIFYCMLECVNGG